MAKSLSLALILLALLIVPVWAQKPTKGDKGDGERSVTERQLKEFYDAYAEDLRKQRREAIADRYDRRGYFRVGNGVKKFVSYEDNKKLYLTQWSGPKTFEFKDLSFEILSQSSAVVIGVGEWEAMSGERSSIAYSALLTRQADGWRVRVEDESVNTRGYTTSNISGDRNTPGPWKYSLTAQPGARISAHRHTSAMNIKVVKGRKFILIGDLDTAKVQRFDAGSTFVIPANTWHVEWWETETVEEIEIAAPTITERAVPSTPRSPR